MPQNEIEARVRYLENTVRFLTGLCCLLIMIVGVTVMHRSVHAVKAAADGHTLRLRCLVIKDALGHARILLGAPTPVVHERLGEAPPTTAIVFLDEKGDDPFLLGEMTSATPAFHRISEKSTSSRP